MKMSLSDYPPLPIFPLRVFPEENEEEQLSLEEQLQLMAQAHPVNELRGRPSLVQIPSVLVFCESPEGTFEARLSIRNTSTTLLTYTVYASSDLFTQYPSCGLIKPCESVIVACSTQRESHDYALTLFHETRYSVHVMEYPNNGPSSLNPLLTYWAAAPQDESNIQVTWIENLIFLKTPEGFQKQGLEAMDAFQTGGRGDQLAEPEIQDGDEDDEEDGEGELEEEKPTWLDMEGNWEYLGVGLRPYTEALLDGAERINEVELDQEDGNEDPSYFGGIPNWILQTPTQRLPWIALGGIILAGGSCFIWKIINDFINNPTDLIH